MNKLDGKEMFAPMYHLELVRDRGVPYRKCFPVSEAAQILHEVLDRSPVEQFVCIHMSSDGKMVELSWREFPGSFWVTTIRLVMRLPVSRTST